SELDQGLRLDEHLLPVGDDGQVDAGGAGLLVEGADGPADLQGGALRVGGVGAGRVLDDDGLGEAGLVVDDGPGIADPVLDQRDGGTHGEHAVRDDSGQADLGGEALVPVDRVEVPAGPGIADQVGPVHVQGGATDLLALLKGGEVGGFHAASSP